METTATQAMPEINYVQAYGDYRNVREIMALVCKPSLLVTEPRVYKLVHVEGNRATVRILLKRRTAYFMKYYQAILDGGMLIFCN